MTTCPCAGLCIGPVQFARMHVFHIIWYLSVVLYVFSVRIMERENMTVLKSGIVNGMSLLRNRSCAKYAALVKGKFSPSLTFMLNSHKILIMYEIPFNMLAIQYCPASHLLTLAA